MKAAIAALTVAALDLAGSFTANTTIDASEHADTANRAGRRNAIRRINNVIYLGLGRRTNGKVYHYARMSNYNAEMLAARLALDVLKVKGTFDPQTGNVFAICDSRPAGVEIVEGLNEKRAELAARAAGIESDLAWSRYEVTPADYRRA